MPKSLAAAVLAALVAGAGLFAAPAPQSDLDAFMQKVLAKRDDNWKKLQQYVLDEKERIEVRGPGQVPVWGERREYAWYVRDGYFVRSPIKVDGVEIGEGDRRKYEDDYLRQAKARDQARRGGPPPDAGRGNSGRAGGPPPPAAPPPPVEPPAAQSADPPNDVQGLIRETRQPEFIDSAYFLRFKFEQGKYAFVGKETIDGRELYRIEYYPERLFSSAQTREDRRTKAGRSNRGDQYDAALERLMNKVALVTIWVEPKAYQIVRYTFDNVNFDFLPVAWLVRVTDVKASMNMSQPFPDVWLPKDVDMRVAAMMAFGAFDVRYQLDYANYKLASTSVRIK